MKKLALLIAVMLLVSAFTFAEDVEFTVEGDATVTFGINLNEDVATGFTNETSSNLKFTFVTEQDVEKGSDEAVYGWIKLKEFKTVVEDGEMKISNPGVEAKIMAAPIWIEIHEAPSVEVNKASITSSVADGVGVVDRDLVAADWEKSGGVTIGVDLPDLVGIELEVVSANDWKQDDEGTAGGEWGWIDDDDNEESDAVWGQTAAVAPVDDLNDENAYAVSVEFDVKAVENLSLTGQATVAKDYAMDVMAFGVQGGYEISLTDDISVKPIVGFDMKIDNDAEESRYEVGGGVQLKTPGTWDDNKDNKVFPDDDNDDFDKVYSGVSIGINYGNNALDTIATEISGVDTLIPDDKAVLNLVISAYEDSGDDGLLPMLGYTVVFELADLTNTIGDIYDLSILTMGLGIFADVTIDNIKPYAGLKYYMVSVDDESSTSAELWAGVEISDIIPNTTLMLDYHSTELIEDEDIGQVMDNGIFTTAVKIAY